MLEICSAILVTSQNPFVVARPTLMANILKIYSLPQKKSYRYIFFQGQLMFIAIDLLINSYGKDR